MYYQVIIIFGIYGALRCEELTNLKFADIERQGNLLLVKIPKTKTYVAKSFTISPEGQPWVMQYIKLRPAHCTEQRFFYNIKEKTINVHPRYIILRTYN